MCDVPLNTIKVVSEQIMHRIAYVENTFELYEIDFGDSLVSKQISSTIQRATKEEIV